ncbi:MAG: energy transducer TonB [Acidobacteria bacterium]|nr:energy transducer TonB [Acidobacteriota bacterium]MCA1640914.1 energy transducer TonB [Acidobacteriota bacterium]
MKSASGTVVAPAPQQVVERDPASWKTFASDAGGFVILFPGTPATTKHAVRLGDKPVELNIYSLKTLAEYSVMYADYPIPIGDPAVARAVLDNGAKGAVAAANSELLSLTEISLDGHPGRLLKELMPGGEILRAKMLLVGRRLYQVAITTPDERGLPADTKSLYENMADKFLNSFKLSPLKASQDNEAHRYVEQHPGEVLNLKQLVRDSPDRIKGGKIISRPLPFYPPAARAAHVTGIVLVMVVVNEEGKVIAAHAVAGHEMLQAAAVEAARAMRFKPILLDDKPVKVWDMIPFTFNIQYHPPPRL